MARSAACRLVSRHPLAAILVLAVVVRLVAFALHSAGSDDPIRLSGDGPSYWQPALHLTHELSFDQIHFLYRPPAYPALIALGLVVTPGNSEWIPIILNVALSVATVGLVYTLAIALGLGRRVGLVAALIMAVEPNSVFMAVTPHSEPLFTLAFVTALILGAWAIRTPDKAVRYAALSGLAAGIAVLTKPAGVGLGVLLGVALIVAYRKKMGRRIVVAALVLAGISLVPYAAWTYSNERTFGVPQFSSASNWNLYFKRGTSTIRRATGESPKVIEERLADRLSRELGESPGLSTFDDYALKRLRDEQAIMSMRDLAFEVYLDHPPEFVLQYGVAAAKLFFEPPERLGAQTVVWVLCNALLFGLALLGFQRMLRMHHFVAGLLLSLIVFFTFAWTTVEGSPSTRILMPLIPVMAVAAAVALAPRTSSPQGPRLAAEATAAPTA